ncbi:MAG: UDP-N-acetyl-D-glucosamine 2-epimerase, UDP-hydrolysing [Rhodobacterales bacterium RIFCSPHIGHO2_02_FULL_62_130]|nr:MAG: UDP-N-acetyl-D-glucosamine 2-epimerase, UDP-hydrolysing [Rhodobacterales bacterium RIFCSPHIGHO2_02_FULL_62_130]OHC60301.1 MAG: UDP-N-acetyl-D-glucosamine 2-epimerase, UDP-hydrolysing [Rhodobacterales bacterium RIFCSPHIGHO2_12_FULL_62_75]HCZ01555.1 UDP-N-acetylglucosamine 2-epimerase (hydrolyzing) [Rhodobacter sp.]
MKVLALTGTRADWGLLVPVLNLLRDDDRFDLQIAATGQHLMAGSCSLKAIAADGHRVDHLVEMGLGCDDSTVALARGMGAATAGLGAVLAFSRPDLLMVLGDRYEILAAALAAVVARVPIAHIFGGDVTEGAIDDSIRHALTKLGALHFPSNAESAARIMQMGEDPLRVHCVGSTGIDRILALEPMERDRFFTSVGIAPRTKNFLITFHPATLSDDSTAQAQAMLDALDAFPEVGLIFTGSNADPGAREIDALIEAYVAGRDGAVFHTSLGSRRYFSALTHCDLVIGNSSSGVMEAPSFRLPTVNIGDRQARRPRAASVIDCDPIPSAIYNAIRAGLARDRTNVENPYGDGHAAERIVAVLAAVNACQTLVRKSFVDLPR